jgi:hypothetical protein
MPGIPDQIHVAQNNNGGIRDYVHPVAWSFAVSDQHHYFIDPALTQIILVAASKMGVDNKNLLIQ